MAFVTTGLRKNAQGQAGVTPHYHFSYDSSFAAPGDYPFRFRPNLSLYTPPTRVKP
jgi:hypothetical protein